MATQTTPLAANQKNMARRAVSALFATVDSSDEALAWIIKPFQP